MDNSHDSNKPVAWQYRDANDDGTWGAWLGCDKRLTESTWREVRPLYTTPPAAQPAPDCKETGVCVKTGLACFGQAAQPAVPMTDQQIDDEHDKLFPPTIIPGARARVREFARAIEAKLKEKNT